MTNLKIGTILIANEDRLFKNELQITKGKEYPIFDLKETDSGYPTIIINDDNGHRWHMSGIHTLNDNFTIKRYTLSDLYERKIAVKLRNEEEFKKILNILDVRKSSEFYENEKYYGIDDDGDFYYLLNGELEGRILLESIDEIDLDEGKEEIVNECEISPLYVNNLESEIARLKGELEKSQEAGKCIAEKLADEMKEKVAYMEEVNRLKGENELQLTQINQLKEYNEKLLSENSLFNDELLKVTHEKDSFIEKSTSMIDSLKKASEYLTTELIKENQKLKSPDLTKRERMAWELLFQDGGLTSTDEAINIAFEIVDKFLAKSKEVGK